MREATKRAIVAIVAAVVLGSSVTYAQTSCDGFRNRLMDRAVVEYGRCIQQRNWAEWMYSWFNDECANNRDGALMQIENDYATCLVMRAAGEPWCPPDGSPCDSI